MTAIFKFVGKTLFDPIQYAQDSYYITKEALFSLPPDPLPTLTLLGLVITLLRLAQKFFSLQRKVKISDIILFTAAWAGFDTMKQYKTHQLFKRSVDQLKDQLAAAEVQLKAWEDWYQNLKRDLSHLHQVVSTLEGASQELSEASQTLFHSIEQGQKLLKEGEKETYQARQALGDLIKEKKKTNQDLTNLIEEFKQVPHQEVVALIPQLQKLIGPWNEKIQRLENLIKQLKEKCLSSQVCPHCNQQFTPLEAFIKEKNNESTSQRSLPFIPI